MDNLPDTCQSCGVLAGDVHSEFCLTHYVDVQAADRLPKHAWLEAAQHGQELETCDED